jgi:hypothetical protein
MGSNGRALTKAEREKDYGAGAREVLLLREGLGFSSL